MSFGDLSARMKQARAKKEAEKEGDTKPFDHGESYRLRAKMLGVLIRDARLNAARTLEDCARLLRLQPNEIEAWEYGDAVPSLPQLELLAYYLDVPISHFWAQSTIEKEREVAPDAQKQYLALRQRMIGALLRQAREAANLTIERVAEQTFISPERLATYELGESAIPMHELSAIASALNQRMNYFLEPSSQIGDLLTIREEWKKFTDLDPEIREFAANPSHVGFIKIAMMFSKMPTEQLRDIAEGMLEITM